MYDVELLAEPIETSLIGITVLRFKVECATRHVVLTTTRVTCSLCLRFRINASYILILIHVMVTYLVQIGIYSYYCK